jgi:hypothetical protein
MNDNLILDDLAAALRDLILRFGRFRVFMGLLRAISRPKTAKNGEIPDYLRRDLGLPPRPPDARMWERHR